jgi:hypothetical protein
MGVVVYRPQLIIESREQTPNRESHIRIGIALSNGHKTQAVESD